MNNNINIDNILFNKLLNRDEISISNTDEINKIRCKNILITGGLGSIGSEILRQLIKLGINNIIIYDNNECNYFFIKNEINNNYFLDNIKLNNIKFILGSINDYDKLEYILKNNKIDIVYHAAAYKHVPIMEENEYESLKVNIIGTKNIADLSLKYGIETFVLVSTDKAVNPTNVMGASKRVSELYIQYLWNKYKKTKFIITRFGNVLGSSGSVIPSFLKNINENKDLLITHKDITRYFMTIPEASKLVLLSSCVANGGNIILFDMGEPVKIMDLARNLLNMFQITNINIKLTSLRPGEKMYEELYGKTEDIIKTKYEKILLLKNQQFDYDKFIVDYNDLIKIKYHSDNSNIRLLLKKIVPEFKYKENKIIHEPTPDSESKHEWPQMNDKMINSVTTILKSGKLNQWNNNTVKEFENKFAEYIKCNYAVAVFNGTVALELCVKTLGLKEGDEIIVTPRTFLASASCCAWYGIIPIFVDVDINSQNITLETIKTAITKKTKAVILVHLAGWPCDLEEICNYCKENNIYVIEDCAQAHGAKYKGKSVGTWGDINAWSFCQDKIITTGGEGGIVTTNDETLFKKAWSLKDHGKGYDTVYNKTHEPGFRWLHENIGTNWRMLPIQAVIGIHALDELEAWINHRRNIAEIYNENLKDINGIRLTIPPENVYHSYYKYYFFIDSKKFKISRDDLIQEINDNGIFCQIGSCSEVYKEDALKKFEPKEKLEITQKLFNTAFLLKCDPCISKNDALNDILKIKDILNKYSK